MNRVRLGERRDQSIARTLDHLGCALLGKRAEVLVESGAAVGADLVDEGLPGAVQRARAPVRTFETLRSLRGHLGRLELAEKSGHLVRGQVRTAYAVLAEIEPVGVAGGEAHHAGSGSADPDGRPRPLGRLRRAYRVVDAVMLSVIGRAVVLP